MYNYWGFNKHKRPLRPMGDHEMTNVGYFPNNHNGLTKYGQPYGMYFWYILKIKIPNFSKTPADSNLQANDDD